VRGDEARGERWTSAQVAHADAVPERREAAGIVLAIANERVSREDGGRIESSERVDQTHHASGLVGAVEADVRVHAGGESARAARLGELSQLGDAVLRHQLMFADVVREVGASQ